MKFSLTRETKSPSRGNIGDAGIDVYVPEFTNQFIEDFCKLNQDAKWDYEIVGDKLFVNAGKRIKLPTGAFFNIPENNMLLVLQKTSVPNKTGIISGARVIDASYQGEFIASLINTSLRKEYLQSGTKFIQLVLVPINPDYSLEQTKFEELFEGKESTRGTGAFGSTGES